MHGTFDYRTTRDKQSCHAPVFEETESPNEIVTRSFRARVVDKNEFGEVLIEKNVSNREREREGILKYFQTLFALEISISKTLAHV